MEDNSRIYIDDDGKQWLTDDNGTLLKDDFGNKIAPTQSTNRKMVNGFTIYDTTQGHCALCGKINCHGNCFK